MTDQSPLSLNQLSQTLQQLAGSVLSGDAANKNQLLSQAAAVLVKTYTTNQILLITDNKQLTLDIPQLKNLALSDGQFFANINTAQQQFTLTPAPQILDSIKLSPKVLDALLKLAEFSTSSAPITLTTQGRVTSVFPNEIKVNVHAQQHPLPINDSSVFKTGQSVRVELTTVGGNWQVKLLPVIPTNTTAATTPPPQTNSNTSNNLTTNTQTAVMTKGTESAPPSNLTSMPPVSSTNQAAAQADQSALLTNTAKVLASGITPSLPMVKSIIQSVLNQSGITITPQTFKQLASLFPEPPALSTASATKAQESSINLLRRGDNLQIQTKPVNAQAITMTLDKIQSQRLSELIQASSPLTQKADTAATSSDNVIPQFRQAVHNLLRQLQPLQDSPSSLMRQLDRLIADPALDKLPEIKLQLQQVMGQLNTSLPQGKEQDPALLRALLTAPMQPLTPIQLINPAPAQGFIAGLITLLQLSMSARIARHAPEQLAKFSESIEQILSGNNKTPPSTKALSDFAQLENQHQLTKNIARLLANHQGSKMASVEQQLQGQDSLFFNFATGQKPEQQDVELLIRREQNKESEKDKKTPKGSRWHLTMKLSLGDVGELLAKATLTNKQLELDFYTSNTQTQHQVMNFLPLLKKRFDALEIELKRSQCQLGKIPATLKLRPYQLLETKV
ncbi:flagellar hook-length control protein FliK [Alteromonadaceae bacterium BrNp21-10]|nr:flagellar hook-length control protein FliK [Alteromonadaceae bacterium BrNp21-10]